MYNKKIISQINLLLSKRVLNNEFGHNCIASGPGTIEYAMMAWLVSTKPVTLSTNLPTRLMVATIAQLVNTESAQLSTTLLAGLCHTLQIFPCLLYMMV